MAVLFKLDDVVLGAKIILVILLLKSLKVIIYIWDAN